MGQVGYCQSYLGSRFKPEGCPAILWMPIFGRNTSKVHLISDNFMGKYAFRNASCQCLTKSLPRIPGGRWVPGGRGLGDLTNPTGDPRWEPGSRAGIQSMKLGSLMNPGSLFTWVLISVFLSLSIIV